MLEASMSAITDILESFDVEEVSQLISDQILKREVYTGVMVDQFQPIYANYKKLFNNPDVLEEELTDGIEKFDQICDAILGIIKEKFNVSIDDGWLSDNAGSKPAITLALYTFFVIDLYNNLREILFNYINENQKMLYEQFKDIPRKPISKKQLPPQIDVILRNIYDICTFILSQLTPEDALRCLDDGYVFTGILAPLYEDGYMEGDFISAIAEIFNKEIGFKSQIGFDLMYQFHSQIPNKET